MAPRKKKTEDKLKAAKLQAKALELRLLEGLSLSQIAEKLKLQDKMAAKRLLDRAEQNLLREKTDQNYDVWLAKRIHTLETVLAEAWAGWKRSVGRKKKVTDESGENDKGPYSKSRTLSWSDAGDPRFLQIIAGIQTELAGLLGVAKGGGDTSGGGFGEQAGSKSAELIIRQSVYIPGLGHLTPEQFAQMLLDIEAKDDSPTD